LAITAEQIQVIVEAKVDGAISKLNKLENTVRKTSKQSANEFKGFQKAFSDLTKFVSVAAIGNIIFDSFMQGVKGAEEAQDAIMRLSAVYKATGGVVGLTLDQVKDLSVELAKTTLFTDDQVQNAQAILLTFKGIKGTNFEETIRIAADLSTVMGQDLKSSVTQLGKALEDPTRGLTALRKVGVSFTEAETEMIKGLQESGKLFEAQTIILKVLEGQFGGTAESLTTTSTGKLRQLGKQIDDFRDTAVEKMLDIEIVPIENVGDTILKYKQEMLKGNPFQNFKKGAEDLQKSIEVLQEKNKLLQIDEKIMLEIARKKGGVWKALADGDTKRIENNKKLMELANGILTAEKELQRIREKAAYSDSLIASNKQLLEFMKQRRLTAKETATQILAQYNEEFKKQDGINKLLEARSKLTKDINILQRRGRRTEEEKKDLALLLRANNEIERQIGLLKAVKQIQDEPETGAKGLGLLPDATTTSKALGEQQAAIDSFTSKNIKAARLISEAWEETQETLKAGFQDAFASLGEALVTGEDPLKALGNTVKETGAKILDTYGQLLLGMGAVNLLLPGQQALGILQIAGSAGAFTAAGAVRAIPFAQGGSFEVPQGYPNDKFFMPMALTSGERVTVTRKDQQGGGGVTVIQNIQGSVWQDRQLQGLALSAVQKSGRGY